MGTRSWLQKLQIILLFSFGHFPRPHSICLIIFCCLKFKKNNLRIEVPRVRKSFSQWSLFLQKKTFKCGNVFLDKIGISLVKSVGAFFCHLTDSISPSAPSGVLNSPSRGQMFDIMPRTTSFLSRLSTIPNVRPICVRATITRNKDFMLVVGV